MEEHTTNNAGSEASSPNGSRRRFASAEPEVGAALAPPAPDSAHGTVPPQSLELMSDEEFWDYAHERANSISISGSGETSSPQYLECRLNCGAFLIPLHSLCEVMKAPHHYALLPHIPQWMLGIMVWRGRAIAVIDLNAYLCETPGQGGIDPSHSTLLIANDPQHAEISVGLYVHLAGMIDSQVYDERSLPGFPIIDMSMLLADVVRQIGIAAYNG